MPIAPRARAAPIARNTSPRSRSSRWPRRRAMNSAASRWCCRSRPASRRSARRWKRRSAATRRAADYRVAEVTTRGHLRDRGDLPQARPGHHEVRAAEETRRPTSSTNTTRCSKSRRSRSKSRPSPRTRSTPSARATGVYDEGVKKSYAALAELKPGRYGKTEIMSASFDALVPPPPPAQATAGTRRSRRRPIPTGEHRRAPQTAPRRAAPALRRFRSRRRAPTPNSRARSR